MKLMLIALASATLCFSLMPTQFKVDNTFTENNTLKVADTGKKLTFSNFTEVPSDFVPFDKSDILNTKSFISENDLVIEHDKTKGPSNNQYYGGVYKILPDNAIYENFTFEMQFKMTNWADSARWIGVGYHLQDDSSNNMTGYLMNYRMQDTRSAYSTIDSNQNFYDVATSGNKPINDGAYHTLKITMDGNIATHYMDNKEIVSWDVSTSDAYLGSTYKDGYFAIFVNRSTINIKSIKITDEVLAPSEFDDSSLISTYQNETSIVNAPTVVSYINTKDDLEALKGDIKPSNAILRFNANKEIVGENGEIFGNASDVINNYLQWKIIPIFEVENEEECTSLIDFLSNDRVLFDTSILSSDSDLITKLKRQLSYVRAILKVNEIPENIFDLVTTSTKIGANTILLKQSDSTVENINYLQARFKTVWTMVNNLDENSLHGVIFSGTCGLVNSNFLSLYNKLNSYKGENILTRKPFNVAHRGLPKSTNECSLYGINKAIEAGATHLELDAYMTMDRQIVISHDRTLDRCTNGVGNLEQMTYSQVRSYYLDLFEPYEPIPDLYEVLDVIKDNDVILVLEIKSEQDDLVDVLKEVLDQYNIYDKVVVISFYNHILEKMHNTLPSVPTANLNTVSTGNFSTRLEEMGKYGCVTDTPSGSSLLNEKYLRDRGILGWYWTMDNETDLAISVQEGLVGLTNNVADVLGEYVQDIKFNDNMKSNLSVGDSFQAVGIKYNKKEIPLDVTIEAVMTIEEKQYISVRYEDNYVTYITPFMLASQKDENVSTPNGNNMPLIIGLSTGLAAIVIIGGVVTFILLKKRK